jgi:membrane protein implicated in regulation of membrane protease activity
MIGAGAIAALAAAAVWGHRAWAAPTEVAVSVVASLVLAAAHWRNFSAVRRLHRHY